MGKTDSLECLKEYIINSVAEEIENLEKSNKFPFMASLDEILRKAVEDSKDILRECCREKFLTAHKNINGKVYIEFTPPN